MDLVKWNKVYLNNQKLDDIFKDKYKNDNKLFEKNEIELLVEIGEFINETKVFKYWTKKQPDKDKMLDEYADVITMVLSFYHEFNMDIKDLVLDIEEKDLLILFKYLYKYTLKFLEENSREYLEILFKYTIYIGTILEFREEEIIKAIENKHKIIEKRLNSDY